MKKISLIILFNLLLMLNGCAKKISNEETQASSETDTTDSEYIDTNSYLYDFPYISNDNFYDDVIVANNEELYRKLRFNDFEIGSKVIGAGLVHILQNQDDGRQTAIISTKTRHNMNAGLYELLASKANFNGNFALLVFNPSEKARILNDDVIAFKGVLAPSDTYIYTNDSGEIEEIPIIYVHYYKAGDLTMPLINKFIDKPKPVKNDNNAIKTENEERLVQKDNSEIRKKDEQTQQAVEKENNVKKLTDSTEVTWKRQPKVGFTSADLEGEPRSAVVMVEANERGMVTNVVITKSSGLPALDEKIIRATKFARFEPYVENGINYPISAELPFEFSP